jgi:hypothetical protein
MSTMAGLSVNTRPKTKEEKGRSAYLTHFDFKDNRVTRKRKPKRGTNSNNIFSFGGIS